MLKDPRVSISITLAKAFDDSPAIGDRKFPAAPALSWINTKPVKAEEDDQHYKINASQLLHTPRNRTFQRCDAANVDSSYADHFGSRPSSCDAFGHRLRLLDIAADDAGVCAKMHKGSHLCRADGSCPAGTEDDFVVWWCRISYSNMYEGARGGAQLPKMPFCQTLERYSDLGMAMLLYLR